MTRSLHGPDVPSVETITDRQALGELLTGLREDRSVRSLETEVRQRVGEQDAVVYSTIASWCRGDSVPAPRQLPAFRALLAALEVTDDAPWIEATRRIRAHKELGPSPYPGLAPFSQEQRDTFFGREDIVATMVGSIVEGREPTVRILVGSSGSGKTSLVQAGVGPRLADQGWQIETIAAGSDPDTELERLRSAVPGPTLMIVDRFEQILGAGVERSVRDRYVDAALAPVPDRTVLLVLRSDYYEPAATDPRLREVLQGSQVVVGPMSENELRRAVVEPARAAGATMPDALLEVVVTEARGYSATGHQGLLPHLSTALRATWEAAGQGALSVADYRAAGGITGAIEQTAEAAYAGLDPEAREVLRHLLLRLVNVSHEGPLTRRSATKDELADLTATVPQTDLVEHLTAARLLSVSTDQVELAHESLLTAWPRLTRWIEDARADLEPRPSCATPPPRGTSTDGSSGTSPAARPTTASPPWPTGAPSC
ncbi:hypothetical protein GCM10027055_13720 [Janibacter alkaliphilus]|uniref:Novel STAND NTPase 1 domain-containing protein n=1 Tax=Janibacter alkaliphilus TaxID=1069963 RepID=A0A852X3J8_9MICO|nr:ATP-binding protein [Janibacter alkaliphilus]NYG37636.1 hypothetical protein [Janibacter alkaliphilus]